MCKFVIGCRRYVVDTVCVCTCVCVCKRCLGEEPWRVVPSVVLPPGLQSAEQTSTATCRNTEGKEGPATQSLFLKSARGDSGFVRRLCGPPAPHLQSNWSALFAQKRNSIISSGLMHSFVCVCTCVFPPRNLKLRLNTAQVEPH